MCGYGHKTYSFPHSIPTILKTHTHQEDRAGDGKGLFVEISCGKDTEHSAILLLPQPLQLRDQGPQLVQVGGERERRSADRVELFSHA